MAEAEGRARREEKRGDRGERQVNGTTSVTGATTRRHVHAYVRSFSGDGRMNMSSREGAGRRQRRQ